MVALRWLQTAVGLKLSCRFGKPDLAIGMGLERLARWSQASDACGNWCQETLELPAGARQSQFRIWKGSGKLQNAESLEQGVYRDWSGHGARRVQGALRHRVCVASAASQVRRSLRSVWCSAGLSVVTHR